MSIERTAAWQPCVFGHLHLEIFNIYLISSNFSEWDRKTKKSGQVFATVVTVNKRAIHTIFRLTGFPKLFLQWVNVVAILAKSIVSIRNPLSVYKSETVSHSHNLVVFVLCGMHVSFFQEIKHATIFWFRSRHARKTWRLAFSRP